MLKTKLMDSLTEEQEEHVLKEINYSRKQLKLDIQLIKDWLKEQHHLPPSRLKEDDKFFESYLTGCKGSLETVKQRLDNLYTIRSHSEIFENRDPLLPRSIAAAAFNKCAILPHTTPTGERILILEYDVPDLEQFDHLNFGRIFVNRLEIYLRQAGISSRVYIIVDFKNTPSSFVLKLSPVITRDVIFFLENAISMRIMKLTIINVPHVVEIALNKLILPFLSKKLQERLQFISDGAVVLHKYFSPKILPRDFGGEASNPSFHEYSVKWEKFIEENRSWFLNELSEKVDESKRVKTDKYVQHDSYFGVHGSLKKLVID